MDKGVFAVSFPSGIDRNQHDVNELRVMPLDEIRTFFARRGWLRPDDWPVIEARQSIPLKRQRDLSCFIHGYMQAKA